MQQRTDAGTDANAKREIVECYTERDADTHRQREPGTIVLAEVLEHGLSPQMPRGVAAT